jgi:1,4-alpha-glucan branching enzyme
MGSEFAQRNEWNVNLPLEWHLSEKPAHAGVECLLSDLNRLYRSEPALHELDFGESGFVGINCDDDENSTISFIRRGKSSGDIVIVCNFSARAHHGYRIGIPRGGVWRELLNTDAEEYGGSGQGNLGRVEADSLPAHHHTCSLALTLPPLSTIYLKRQESHK